MTAPRLRRRAPVAHREQFGPFRGMRCVTDEPANRNDTVHYALNLTCADPTSGTAYTVRPPAVGTSGLPGGITRLFHVFESRSGTIPVALSSTRELWSLQGDTTWGRLVSSADFSTAGIALDPTVTTFYAVTILGLMIVSDGVNTPWMWDGTSGSAGLTLLSNCPVLYGQPTEYAGKLFGIRADDRHTIVWSEESDPTTGYEAGGFNNAWTLSQQSETELVRLHGRNDGLYYWRRRGFGLVAGAVASDFRTTHTQDALSQDIGLAGPGAVADTGDALWWYGSNERIYVHPVGGREVVDISPEITSQHSDDLVLQYVPRWFRTGDSQFAAEEIVTSRAAVIGPNDVNDRRQVWFSLPGFYETSTGAVGQDSSVIALLYDADTRRPVSWYTREPASATGGNPIGTFRNLSVFASADGLHGLFAVASDVGINAPALWHWQTINQNPTENGATVTGILIGPVAGGSTDIEQTWTQCDVVCRVPPVTSTGSGTLTLEPWTVLDTAPDPLTATVGDPTNISLSPVDLSPSNQRVAFGLEVVGRAMRPVWELIWSAPTNFGNRQGFGIERYSLVSRALAEEPDAY